MANLTETATYDAGVYQLETTDPVVGGPNGASNAPLKNLANRTKYLKTHMDAAEVSLGLLTSIESIKFIDAVNGNDANTGTRSLPLKTIKAAVDQGVAGSDRTLYLREGQTHYVSPASPTVVRGGRVYISMYGPLLDAIPHPYGAANYATPEALALGTTIEATEFITSGTLVANGGAGIWQVASAFIAADDATISPVGITFIPGKPIPGSIYPVSRDCASFSNYWNGANWNFYNCKLKTTQVSQLFFGEAIRQPISIFFLAYNVLEGPGKLAICNSKMMTVTKEGAGFTEDQLRGMLVAAEASSGVYTSFNTNLLPGIRTSSLVAANGYEKQSDGLIKQWGVINIFNLVPSPTGGAMPSAFLTITFPIPFPNQCFGIYANGLDSGASEGSEMNIGVSSMTLSSAVLRVTRTYGDNTNSNESLSVMFSAIGR